MPYYTQAQHSDIVAIDSEKKPTKFKMQIGYPYCDLDDRDFERLVYLLHHNEIGHGTGYEFDEVRLMQGVGERGRDCTLYLDAKCVGVIQCKRLATNLDRPTLGKEIIKFALNSILDKSLRGTEADFRYIVAVARGFSEPAVKLRDEWNTQALID
jgi:hypothetical protein